ncbi:MAG: hypothetical protein ACI81R_003182 [Bradymonadia bacterium]|jgi:hypothetical protein
MSTLAQRAPRSVRASLSESLSSLKPTMVLGLLPTLCLFGWGIAQMAKPELLHAVCPPSTTACSMLLALPIPPQVTCGVVSVVLALLHLDAFFERELDAWLLALTTWGVVAWMSLVAGGTQNVLGPLWFGVVGPLCTVLGAVVRARNGAT